MSSEVAEIPAKFTDGGKSDTLSGASPKLRLLTLKGWPTDCFKWRMANSVLAKWYVSDNVCALCDPERHLAHVVRLRSQWFVIDATHTSFEKLGCLFIGSFARRQTAMQAAEAEVLGHPAPVAMRRGAPDMSRVRGLAAALLRQTHRPSTDRSSQARSAA